MNESIDLDNRVLREVNSIFEQPWWLDTVSKKGWESFEVKNGDQVFARLPYINKKIICFSIITTPLLTQTLGIYIKDTGAKLTKRMEKEKKIINKIIDQIPPHTNVDFYFDPSFRNFLPFVWRGFTIEPRVTYQLDDLNNLDKIFKGLKENIKTDIRKAEKKVEIIYNDSIETVFEMQKKTFNRQGRKMPFTLDFLKKIECEAKKKNACQTISAVDQYGNVHASGFFLYDDKRCYYLIGGGDPQYRNSGAGSLVVWEGIRLASKVSKIFDFEGSMIEDIERFFRAFGAEQKIYYHVYRYNAIYNVYVKFRNTIKSILKYK